MKTIFSAKNMNKNTKAALILVLFTSYLISGLLFAGFHQQYSSLDDQATNIYNGYQMTRGQFFLNRSHPVGTQSLYAVLFLLTGRDYDFTGLIDQGTRSYLSQGLLIAKILNFSLVFLILLMSYKLLLDWGVPTLYRWLIVIMLGFNPYLMFHASYALSTIPYAFFLTLAFYNYQNLGRKRLWWISGVTFALPYYFKFNGLALIYVFAVTLTWEVFRRRINWKRALLIILVSLVTITPRLILRQLKFGNAFYHLSMHNMWMDRRAPEVYLEFTQKYNLDMKTLAGYKFVRQLYFKTHSFTQMLKRGWKGLLVLFLTTFPAHWGGLLPFVLTLTGFFLAWRQRFFLPLLLFIIITSSGLAWLAKAGPPPLFRWSQFIPILTFPFLGFTFKYLHARRALAAKISGVILCLNFLLLNFHAYPAVRKTRLAVQNVSTVVNYAPTFRKWLFTNPDILTDWKFSKQPFNGDITNAGVTITVTPQTILTSPPIDTSTFWINYLKMTVRIDNAAKPVKGKIYFTTNYQPNYSEVRVYRVLFRNDQKFHTHKIYLGGYFDLKKGEKLDRLVFMPSVDADVQLTLKSIGLSF